MKICIANYEPGRMGGGWTFADNFSSALGSNQCPYDKADIYFIAGATMVERKDVEKAKTDGKKVVLRIDNHLLPSRNRNAGMQKLNDFAEMADLIVYQSQWAKDYLGGVLGKDGVVILNGVDLDLFTPGVSNPDWFAYARSSRIAEKGWEMARHWYSRNNSDKSFLGIMGKFSGENIDNNFDFINGENYRFYGQLDHRSFASLIRLHGNFLYSYFMDACSNTLIEALASGCKIIDVYGMLKTGGAPEVMEAYNKNGREYFSLHRMTGEYIKVMEQL